MDVELVAVGTSYGGLQALSILLEGIPATFPAAIAIVQHRSRDSDDTFQRLLQDHSKLPVQEVEDKEPIVGSCVYVAPPDYHLLVERRAFALSVDAPVAFSRPSIDVFFESAAEAMGPKVVGVLLTGANADGARGLQEIRAAGGYTIVQDPTTALGRAMPEAGIALGPVDAVVPLDAISARLVDLCSSRGAAPPQRRSV
jgi:two-component system chemotaxis response regulator CheB